MDIYTNICISNTATGWGCCGFIQNGTAWKNNMYMLFLSEYVVFPRHVEKSNMSVIESQGPLN